MKTATAKEIKLELENNSSARLLEMIMRLIRFKKENKELLTYLLFEAGNEAGYVAGIKETLHPLFTEVNVKSYYITRKNLRKIIRIANRFIKYSDDDETGIQVMLYVCEEVKQLNLALHKSTALQNLYLGLLKKTEKSIMLLHEDLQYDYLKELKKLV